MTISKIRTCITSNRLKRFIVKYQNIFNVKKKLSSNIPSLSVVLSQLMPSQDIYPSQDIPTILAAILFKKPLTIMNVSQYNIRNRCNNYQSAPTLVFNPMPNSLTFEI